MANPRVYADFNNADARGRLRLTCAGTIEDIRDQGIALGEGLRLTFYADDGNELGDLDELLAHGFVEYSEEERCWVGVIDWQSIHHASEAPSTNEHVTTFKGPKPCSIDAIS